MAVIIKDFRLLMVVTDNQCKELFKLIDLPISFDYARNQ
jgi:hypothetical protein